MKTTNDMANPNEVPKYTQVIVKKDLINKFHNVFSDTNAIGSMERCLHF